MMQESMQTASAACSSGEEAAEGVDILPKYQSSSEDFD